MSMAERRAGIKQQDRALSQQEKLFEMMQSSCMREHCPTYWDLPWARSTW